MFSFRKLLARLGFYVTFIDPKTAEIWSRFEPVSTGHRFFRLGTLDGDGGYLVPDCLEGIQGLFSAGISDNCDFEIDFARLLAKPVYMLDPSIRKPPRNNSLFRFQASFLQGESNQIGVSLDDWVTQSECSAGDLLLSVDIEGSEFQVFAGATRNVLNRFRIIVLEIHSLEEMASNAGFDRLRELMDKLLANHVIVHAHGNNVGGIWTFPNGVNVPSGIEITLLRKDFVGPQGGTEWVPSLLDQKCDPSRPEVELKFGPVRR